MTVQVVTEQRYGTGAKVRRIAPQPAFGGPQFTILFLDAICAIICGANDWEAVAEFGRSKVVWFKTFLALPNGIPSHDTFWRVFRALDPASFQRCFGNWMRAVSPLLGGQVIALDGKQLRRSHDRGCAQAAIYMVSAWATANRLVLGQRKVAATDL